MIFNINVLIIFRNHKHEENIFDFIYYKSVITLNTTEHRIGLTSRDALSSHIRIYTAEPRKSKNSITNQNAEQPQEKKSNFQYLPRNIVNFKFSWFFSDLDLPELGLTTISPSIFYYIVSGV